MLLRAILVAAGWLASLPAAGALATTPASLDFGGQSMRTTAPAQPVTLTNAGASAVDVTSIMVPADFAVSHDCGRLAPQATCTARVSFTPTVEAAVVGSLEIQASGGAQSVALSGTGERSLVTHYYRAILRRAPDEDGKAFWGGEAARLRALGANANEAWRAMAAAFFASPEYTGFARDDAGFVQDLYTTFFNRAPDADGAAFWQAQLAGGMPRPAALAAFTFSPEFTGFTAAIFGNSAVRREIDTVTDFYRGLLGRLPDDIGLRFWRDRFRAAQCAGAAQVVAEAEAISSLFLSSPEYAARNRSDAQFVGDLYNAFLRRGGELQGVRFWIDQASSGAMSRDRMRREFVASAEFQDRVQSIVAEGCAGDAPPVDIPAAGMRVEESDAAVTLGGAWTGADPASGWSGGSAVQSTAAGATVSITFVGTSIRWIGSRGRGMGIALVSVDGIPVREVDLFSRPTDEVHAPVVTIHGLSDGAHTLTIRVTGRQNSQAQGTLVVVDAFDVQPAETVSHWQDTNPELEYGSGWTKASDGLAWSGSGVSNLPELPVTAQETATAGASMTVPFRGTGIGWIGYRGPDAGIAQVQLDGGAPTEVDLYSPTATYQPVVFTAAGLADGNHALTIRATGRKNAASSAARVVVDAFDVMTPGRRYEDYDAEVSYTGQWTPDNTARVWSEGMTAASNQPGATASFRFVGRSVSWIGCRKGSAGGTANVFIDGAFVKEVRLTEAYPIEGYQVTVFRADDLDPGPHTLRIEVTNANGAYVVVDAFDVRP